MVNCSFYFFYNFYFFLSCWTRTEERCYQVLSGRLKGDNSLRIFKRQGGISFLIAFVVYLDR